MDTQSLQKQLKIEKASSNDWTIILELLNETGLADWLTGNENYKNFYVVKETSKNNIIGCFAIDYENKTGILKSFAIRKELQGTGLGKHIANKVTDIARRLGLKKVYASSWEAPGFWKKTNFEEVNPKESKDTFFLTYVNYLEKNFPQFSKNRKHFVLNI